MQHLKFFAPCFLFVLAGCSDEQAFGYETPSSFECPQYDPKKDTGPLYLIKKGNRYGYMNRAGKEVISTVYDQAFNFEQGFAFVSDGSLHHFIDKTGKEIISEKIPGGPYLDVLGYTDGLTEVSFITNHMHKTGFANRKGKVVIPAFFDRAWQFHDGMARVAVYDPAFTTAEEESFAIRDAERHKRERWGYINTKGILAAKFIYHIAWDFENGLAHVGTMTEEELNRDMPFGVGRHGFIDKTGKEIIPLIYEDAQSFSEGLAAVKKNGKWGFINAKGEMVIQPQFEMAEPFKEGMAAVSKKSEDYENFYGFIDKKGKLVIPYKYNSVTWFENGMVCACIGEKYGCLNKKGEWVIQPIFDGLIFFSEGIGKTEIDKKTCYIDAKGNLITQTLFDDGEAFANGLAAVFFGGYNNPLHQNLKMGYIDKTGKYVREPVW